MQNKNKAFLMFSLVSSIMCTQNAHADSYEKSFWSGLGAAATAIAVGVGIAKLADWCFTETNAQLVNRARLEWNNIFAYNEMIIRWQRTYAVSRSEQHLCDFAAALWAKGVKQQAYVSEVTNAKMRCNEVSRTLHTRINEQRGRCLTSDELRELSEMRHALNDIDQMLPQFTQFADGLEAHRAFFELYDYGMRLYAYYDKEIRIIKTDMHSHALAYDIRQAVLYRNSDKKYPFIAFVNKINDHISLLQSYLCATKNRYTIVVYNGTMLHDFLCSIHRIALSDPLYSSERYQIEQERLERLRIEALQEQARIEQAQLYALREQNHILERANRLKEKEMYQYRYDREYGKEYGTDVKVVVNL